MHFIRISGGITGNVHMSGVRDCYMSLQHALNMFRGTQRFVSGNICSEGQKSPEIFGCNCSES